MVLNPQKPSLSASTLFMKKICNSKMIFTFDQISFFKIALFCPVQTSWSSIKRFFERIKAPDDFFFKQNVKKKSKTFIFVMWLTLVNTELGQHFNPCVNHLYNGQTLYHSWSFLLLIQIKLHGEVQTRNVSDKNADDTISSNRKNVQVS